MNNLMMGSQRWVLFIRVFVLIQLVGLHPGTAQEDIWSSYCSPTGNYTEDSDYHQSLDVVLYSSLTLPASGNGYGFYNSSTGHDSEPAYALLLCRGDAPPDTCSSACVDQAILRLRQACPSEKEATGWYNSCFLRYSNRSLVNTWGQSGSVRAYARNTNNASNTSSFNQAVAGLLDSLRGEAAMGGSLRKYAAGNTSTPNFMTIYGIMQCTPDLSQSQCNQCLEMATSQIESCCYGSIGGRVFLSSCLLRYETYLFYNQTWYPPGSLPPGPGASHHSLKFLVTILLIQ